MKVKSEIKTKFDSLQSLYKRLGNNLVEALESFIEEEGISCLNIHFRVKEFESFYEKIERKTYSDPFNDIEDICGIRIICYYTDAE